MTNEQYRKRAVALFVNLDPGVLCQFTLLGEEAFQQVVGLSAKKPLSIGENASLFPPVYSFPIKTYLFDDESNVGTESSANQLLNIVGCCNVCRKGV
jgi:hypothetical protein